MIPRSTVMIPKNVLPSFIIGLIACACTSPSLHPYQTYLPSKTRFYSQVKSVACVPVTYDDSKEAKELSDKVGRLIAAKLQKRNIKSIHHQQWATCWKAEMEKVGGIYDKITGEADKEKLETMWKECVRQMKIQHRVDAVVDPSLMVTSAVLTSDIARWHGVEVDTRSFGTRFWGGGSYSGRVPALSLLVTIYDPQGKKLFENAGGIEVLSDISGSGESAELVPKKQILKSWGKLSRAVDIAFEPLIPTQPSGSE
jgi:hypothetical protein